MPSVYGTDVRALTDLPDPEELCSGDENAAYAVARRHASGEGCMAEIGDDAPYDCFDVEDMLDRDSDDRTRAAVERRSGQVTEDDAFVESSTSVATLSDEGALELEVSAEGVEGPLRLVISVDKLGITLLREG